MKAVLSNHHQSPRKVRLIVDLIRGKSVEEARVALHHLPKKSSPAIDKLLNSAVANARDSGVSQKQLFVKSITVDKGSVLRRYRPFARGRAGTVRKTMSTIKLELGPISAKASNGKRKGKRKTKSK